MKDHTHPEPVKCAHDLGWCAKCERPYCKACGQEWQEQPTYDFSKLTGYRTTITEPSRSTLPTPYSPGITWTAPLTATNAIPPPPILCHGKGV